MSGLAIITEACIGVKDRACVDVCPVQCIYEFDPAKNLYLNQSVFPTQLTYILGNETRFNPKARGFGGLNENVSLAKSFRLTEKFRLDFRAEAFNMFNRVVFSNPQASLDSNSFGRVTGQANAARQAQGALKLYW